MKINSSVKGELKKKTPCKCLTLKWHNIVCDPCIPLFKGRKKTKITTGNHSAKFTWLSFFLESTVIRSISIVSIIQKSKGKTCLLDWKYSDKNSFSCIYLIQIVLSFEEILKLDALYFLSPVRHAFMFFMWRLQKNFTPDLTIRYRRLTIHIRYQKLMWKV